MDIGESTQSQEKPVRGVSYNSNHSGKKALHFVQMSGRGGIGRGCWRRHLTRRGQGQGQCSGKLSESKPSSTPTMKTKMSEHIYHIGSDRQTSDFLVNTMFILNHMQSQFKYGQDIATALKNRTGMDIKALESRKTQSKSEGEEARTD